MNHIYRLVRSRITGSMIAVAEIASCRSGGATSTRAARAVASTVLILATFLTQYSYAAPTGGSVVAGQASINTSGSDTTINQSSQSAILNWQSFDIASHENVRFVQPDTNSVALNRVLGADATSIMGNLSSNGKIFLINPNGILFGKGAQINVGGLVASTRSITDDDFKAGRYQFSGTSDGSITNFGSINADSGYVALLGARVSNQGIITAKLGSIALASGNAFTLDTVGDGLLNVTVNAGAMNALAENGGILRADGGQVLLTAQSASHLIQSVVNNTGVVQAQTIENHNGVIKLLGDMQSGVVALDGKLDASAPSGGDGGFVETSAAHVAIAPNAQVTTLASQGTTGNWLIDPVDFTIAASGGDITGTQLSTNLSGSNVTILSSSGGTGSNGDIIVNDAVSWSANQLTLSAYRNITVNTTMNGSGSASLSLLFGQGAVAAGNTSTITVNAPVNLPAGNSYSTKQGSDGGLADYTVITSLGAAGSTTGADLQGMNGNLNINYALGSDINASATSGWNAGAGFVPIGTDPSRFTGTFDGLGHTVSNIFINRTGANFTGLIGYTAANSMVRNIGMVGGSVMSDGWSTGALVGALGGSLFNSYAATNVTAFQTMGGLVGVIDGGLIDGSHASGTIYSAGNGEVGGLVGLSWGPGGGTTRNSYATGNVSSTVGNVGGLMGINWGTIINSYATGAATGTDYIGGLVGNNSNGSTTGSYATGAVNGNNYVGGLVGNNSNSLTNSYATGNVTAAAIAGGVAGRNTGTFTNNYATGNVATTGNFTGGLIGSNNGTVTLSHATGNVSGGDQIAGLVGGHNSGSISYSYATGTVSATTGASGGLVGYSAAPISNSYATGAVTGINQVGGILGAMNGSTVTDSYATGSVTGTSSVGGVVGNSTNGTITRAYSSGVVTGTTNVGGLLGSSFSATVTNSYWDLTTSGQASSAGGTGLTTTQMLTASNFSGFNFTTTPGATGNNWVMVNFDGTLNGAGNISGGTRPMLASEYSTTLTNAHQLQLMGMNLSANYTLANNIELGVDLANASSLWHAGTGGFAPIGIYGVYNGTFDGLGHTIGGLLINRPADAYVGLFAAVGTTSTVRNVGLIGGSTAGDVYVGSLAGRIEGTVTNSFATTNVSGNFSVGGLVGAVFATGTLNNSYAGGTATSTYAGGLVGLNQGAINSSYATGVVTGTSSGGFAGRNVGGIITSSYSTGAVSGTSSGGFTSADTGTVTNSFWNTTTSGLATSAAGTGLTTAQLQASLPTGFSSTIWGNASNQTTPYLLTNLGPVLIATDTSATNYNVIVTLDQLQNLYTNSTINYALANDIDASATSSWNSGQGFMPIGLASNFTGKFDGLGHVVSNLFIKRPSTNNVGLFGVANGATFSNVGVTSGAITGNTYVGLLVANCFACTYSNVYSTGTSSGIAWVGGLVGLGNGTTMTNSYSTANVTGSSQLVGGLFGQARFFGTIDNSYASGNVSGGSATYVGGLTGQARYITLTNTYATGNVTGGFGVGGLTGILDGATINTSYSSGAVSGSGGVGGLVGTLAQTTAVNNSYWNTTTSGQPSSSGGTGLTNSQMQAAASFSGFDLTSKWIVYEGHTAPLLRSFMTPLTVTANNATKTYDGAAYSGNPGATYSITPNMSNVLGTLTYSAGANAGSQAITPTGLYSNQLGYLITFASGTLTVDPFAVSLTGNRAYNGSANISAGSLTLSTLPNSETLSLTGTGTVASKDVGNGKAITLGSLALNNGTGLASNYTFVGGTYAFDITQALLTATANASNRAYDGSTTASATLGSFVGLIGTETVGPTATATFNTKDVSTANLVTVNGVTLSDGTNGGLAANYSLAAGQTASANITAKALTATATATNKVYDGATTASATLGSLVGLVGTETVVATATSTFNTKDVATANLVTVNSVSLSDGTNGGVASNYNFATGQTAAANITAKALTATAGATNKVYDGTTSASATLGSIVGLVGTETVGTTTTATFNTKDVMTANLVTVNGVTLSDGTNGGFAANYSLTTGQTASANITPKSLTATANAANKAYDGTTTASTTLGSLVGLIGTETVGATATSTFNTKDVVTANLVTVNGVSLSDGTNGGVASNYSFGTGQTAAANITAKALTASANASNKVYDGTTTASASLGSLSGLIGSETLSASVGASFNTKDVSTANLVTINSVNLVNGSNGGVATNYSFATGQGVAANITTKALTVTANASDKVYDGTTSASATLGSIIGLVGTETVGASATATFNTKDVLTANLVTINGVSLSDGTNGGLASNYSLAIGQTASANITAKSLTTTANASNKVYDGTTTAVATLGSLVGLIGSETVGSSATATFNTKDVLTANLVTVNGVSLSDGTNGGVASNYSLGTGQTASASITAKSLTATASATNKVYDGTTTASATLGPIVGLIGTETVGATATATFNTKDVSTANLVTVNGASLSNGTNGGLAGNYSLATGQTAAASITAKALTATANTSNKVYDGTTTASTTLGSLVGLIGAETVGATASSTFNTKDVLTANLVTVIGTSLADGTNGGMASNYSLATGQTAAASIAAKSLTATANASNKVYDGNTTATTTLSSLGGLIGTETVSATATATFNTKDVSTANLVTVNGTSLTDGANGGLASNYSLTSGQTSAANITAKALTATAGATNKVYDGTTTANATLGSITGLIGTETIGTTATATFNTKDVSTANLVTVNGVSLANGTNGGLANNYSLTTGQTSAANITAKALTATANAANKVYDGTTTANATLGSLTGLIGGETVGASATATFNTKDVLTANLVTVNGISLSDGTNGGLASNYSFATGQTAAANITVKALTATANATNKVYDGTTTAIATLASLSGVIGSETLSTSVGATFNSKDVSTANVVTINSVNLANGTNGGLASNYSFATGQTAAANITAKALTATATASDKAYDGNTSASAMLGSTVGLIGTETVGNTAIATFNTKDVLTANLVTVNGISLSDGTNGGLASNYSLDTGQTAAANITAKALTATANASNKAYDGATMATATLGSLSGLIGNETVGTTTVATFNTKDVLTANLVTVNSVSLANGTNGGLASNYSLAAGQTSAALITPLALNATATAYDKVYDGTTTAAPTLNGVFGLIGGETLVVNVTGQFNSKNVVTANTVTIDSVGLTDGINGGLASNYSLATGQTAAAHITQRLLTVAGSVANDKLYDGTDAAAITGGSLAGLISGDSVALSEVGAFATPNAGQQISVAATNTLSGIDSSNYALVQPTGLRADIRAASNAAPVPNGVNPTIAYQSALVLPLAITRGISPAQSTPVNSVHEESSQTSVSSNIGSQIKLNSSVLHIDGLSLSIIDSGLNIPASWRADDHDDKKSSGERDN